MNKMFLNPKTRYRNLLLLILPFLLLIGFFGFIAYKSAKSLIPGDEQTTTYKDSIEEMNYHLRPNATDIQVEYFHELQDLINSGADEHEIVACVAKNYIADFYTWTNKNGSYDIGGMYYVYSPNKSNIIFQARSTYYKYLTYYINKFGKDKMLEVTSVEAKTGEMTGFYYINNKSYKAYFVTCDWTYKNEETFKDLKIDDTDNSGATNNNKFITRMYMLIIVNEDQNGRYEIVQAYGDY